VRGMLLCLAAVALAACGSPTGVKTGIAGASPTPTGVKTGIAGASPTAAAAGRCGSVVAPPVYRHVVWIWMENHSYGDIIGNKAQAPYLNALASECGLATNYHNVSHPSLPNYLAATSGRDRDGLPVLSWLDCSPSVVCDTSAASIFGQGETWTAYQESMPSNCARSNSGEYAVRHNPPPYYEKLSGCASRDVPYARLVADLAANALPAFSFITPNLLHDMHDGTIAQGDAWLASHLPTILNSATYKSGNTAIFITWDEGSGGHPAENCAANTTDASCHIATIVVSPSTRAGTRSGTLFNHYSLLGTAEQLLGLPRLGQASSYPTMTAAFQL
jgi:phosphatidylinositol-3-phosphatase